MIITAYALAILFSQLHPDTRIGSGAPGLKINYFKSSEFAIFIDTPQAVGVGTLGGPERKVEMIGSGTSPIKSSFYDGYQQLYPFSETSAFTCNGGRWDSTNNIFVHSKRHPYLYKSTGEGLLIEDCDIYSKARIEYGLTEDSYFLGKVNNRIIFWNSFNPAKIYWKDPSNNSTYYLDLPPWIIDIYGATRGISTDFGIVVYGKSKGFFSISPYKHAFVPLNFSKGKLLQTTPGPTR